MEIANIGATADPRPRIISYKLQILSFDILSSMAIDATVDLHGSPGCLGEPLPPSPSAPPESAALGGIADLKNSATGDVSSTLD